MSKRIFTVDVMAVQVKAETAEEAAATVGAAIRAGQDLGLFGPLFAVGVRGGDYPAPGEPDDQVAEPARDDAAAIFHGIMDGPTA